MMWEEYLEKFNVAQASGGFLLWCSSLLSFSILHAYSSCAYHQGEIVYIVNAIGLAVGAVIGGMIADFLGRVFVLRLAAAVDAVVLIAAIAAYPEDYELFLILGFVASIACGANHVMSEFLLENADSHYRSLVLLAFPVLFFPVGFMHALIEAMGWKTALIIKFVLIVVTGFYLVSLSDPLIFQSQRNQRGRAPASTSSHNNSYEVPYYSVSRESSPEIGNINRPKISPLRRDSVVLGFLWIFSILAYYLSSLALLSGAETTSGDSYDNICLLAGFPEEEKIGVSRSLQSSPSKSSKSSCSESVGDVIQANIHLVLAEICACVAIVVLSNLRRLGRKYTLSLFSFLSCFFTFLSIFLADQPDGCTFSPLTKFLQFSVCFSLSATIQGLFLYFQEYQSTCNRATISGFCVSLFRLGALISLINNVSDTLPTLQWAVYALDYSYGLFGLHPTSSEHMKAIRIVLAICVLLCGACGGLSLLLPVETKEMMLRVNRTDRFVPMKLVLTPESMNGVSARAPSSFNLGASAGGHSVSHTQGHGRVTYRAAARSVSGSDDEESALFAVDPVESPVFPNGRTSPTYTPNILERARTKLLALLGRPQDTSRRFPSTNVSRRTRIRDGNHVSSRSSGAHRDDTSDQHEEWRDEDFHVSLARRQAERLSIRVPAPATDLQSVSISIKSDPYSHLYSENSPMVRMPSQRTGFYAGSPPSGSLSSMATEGLSPLGLPTHVRTPDGRVVPSSPFFSVLRPKPKPRTGRSTPSLPSSGEKSSISVSSSNSKSLGSLTRRDLSLESVMSIPIEEDLSTSSSSVSLRPSPTFGIGLEPLAGSLARRYPGTIGSDSSFQSGIRIIDVNKLQNFKSLDPGFPARPEAESLFDALQKELSCPEAPLSEKSVSLLLDGLRKFGLLEFLDRIVRAERWSDVQSVLCVLEFWLRCLDVPRSQIALSLAPRSSANIHGTPTTQEAVGILPDVEIEDDNALIRLIVSAYSNANESSVGMAIASGRHFQAAGSSVTRTAILNNINNNYHNTGSIGFDTNSTADSIDEESFETDSEVARRDKLVRDCRFLLQHLSFLGEAEVRQAAIYLRLMRRNHVLQPV